MKILLIKLMSSHLKMSCGVFGWEQDIASVTPIGSVLTERLHP